MYNRLSLAESSSRAPAAALSSPASFGRRSSSRARRAGSWESVKEVFVSSGPVGAFFEVESAVIGVIPSDFAPLLCVRKE
jgi:hypothetical protein